MLTAHTCSLDEVRAGRVDFLVAVKAQVAAGGRGKAGGIRKVYSASEPVDAFGAIMRMRFADEAPASVLVESWLDIERELFLRLRSTAASAASVCFIRRVAGTVRRR
jgi:succinyl-CoA synthetase beta subunit